MAVTTAAAARITAAAAAEKCKPDGAPGGVLRQVYANGRASPVFLIKRLFTIYALRKKCR